MAKSRQSKKAGQFTFSVLPEEDAELELRELRSGRGGRVSKYEPLAKAAAELASNEVIKVRVKKNEVGGLRGYLNRQYGEKYTVRSSKMDDDEYMAYVFTGVSD